MSQSQLDLIVNLCGVLGSINDTERQEAEERLKSFYNMDGFLTTLLEAICYSTANFANRLQAAIYFKNCVTKRWCLATDEKDPDNPSVVLYSPVKDEEKNQIRRVAVQLLLTADDVISRQLIESLIQMGLEDYYIKWPTMMQDLVSCCSSNDVIILFRVLSIVEGMCSKLEMVPDNDIIGDVVLHFIDDLNKFLLEVWNSLSSLLPSVQNDYDRCELVLQCLLHIANIRRYWICVDVIKDINTQDEQENYSCVDLEAWMTFFRDALSLSFPLFNDSPSCTVLENLKAAIIAFCAQCARLYADLFVPYFDSFTTAIWQLLQSIGSADLSLKYQFLAVSALEFFSVVCTKNLYKTSFQSEAMNREMLQVVIVPNCMATEELIDSFENQPSLYVKNYEEGYRMSSQRYAVANLVNSMKLQYGNTFIPLLMGEISSLLQGNDMQKDCAYHLLQYRFVQFPSIIRSARNLDDVNTVSNFIQSVVLNDLMNATSPILQADAAISLSVFLDQLPDSAVLQVIQRCADLISNSIESVKVVNMVLVERILIKYQKQKNAIPCNELEQVVFRLAEYLLNVKQPIKQTDHYQIRLFLRIILFMNTQVLPYSANILPQLINLLSMISSSVSNPHFIHYLFEAIVAFIRISSSQPSLCEQIEQFLTPYLKDYLNCGIIEFIPYVLQIFALLIHARGSASEACNWLLPVVLNDSVWQERSYQTALVFLLRMFLQHNPSLFQAEQVNTLFVLSRELCRRRPSRLDGLSLITGMVSCLPEGMLRSYLPTVVGILMVVVERASQAIREEALLVMSWLMIRFGTELSTRLVLQKGQDAFVVFFRTLFGCRINAMDDVKQKIEAYGITQMILSEEMFYIGNQVALGEGMMTVIQYALRDISRSTFEKSTDFWDKSVEYDAFHKLSLASIESVDPIPEITNIVQLAKDMLQAVAMKCGGSFDSIIQSMPKADGEYLQSSLKKL